LQEDISNEILNDMENVLNSNKLEENLLTWLWKENEKRGQRSKFIMS